MLTLHLLHVQEFSGHYQSAAFTAGLKAESSDISIGLVSSAHNNPYN